MVDRSTERDFLPTANLEMIHARAALTQKVRRFFESREFIEVETPLLSHDIVVDRYIHPVGISKSLVTDRSEDSCDQLWLQTSPEFAMKRLLVGGMDAVFQICKAFRKSETGSRHNPEFTMLEWYRCGDDYQAGMQLLEEFTAEILGQSGIQKISYQNAFLKFAGIDPWTVSADQLANQYRKLTESEVDLDISESTRDDWLNLILAEKVEPFLGSPNPVILFDYPASQAALAKVRVEKDGLEFAERFELYVNGVELANGYHELLDPGEFAKRNFQNNEMRVQDGNQKLPEQSRLLDAMRDGLPPCSGVALGMDRLAMMLTGCDRIDQVIAFPMDRA